MQAQPHPTKQTSACRTLPRGGRNTKHGNILCRKAAAVFEDVSSETTHRPPLFGAKTRHVCSVGCGWPETSRQFSAQTRAMTWRGLAWPGLEGRELAWLSLHSLGLPGVPCLAVPCIALLWRWRTLDFIRQPPCAAIVIVFSFPRLGLGFSVLCTVSFALCLYYGVGTLFFLNYFVSDYA